MEDCRSIALKIVLFSPSRYQGKHVTVVYLEEADVVKSFQLH